MTDVSADFPTLGGGIRPRERDVFISHAREDRDIANLLAKGLSDEGLSVWLRSELAQHEPLYSITNAIRSSGAVIVLLSPASLSSRWMQREVDFALTALPDRNVMPVAVGDVDIRALPSWLADRRWVHLRDERQITRIIEMVRPWLASTVGTQAYSGTVQPGRLYGDLPPRLPLVGVEDYLNGLKVETGLTFIIGAPGAGKTAIAREFAFQVQSSVTFIAWMRAGATPRDSRDLVEQMDRLDSEVRGDPTGRGLVVVDDFDARATGAASIIERLRLLAREHRVVVTTRDLPDSAQHMPIASVIAVGPLSREAAIVYLRTLMPHWSTVDRESIERLVDAIGGAPLVLRIAAQLLDGLTPDEVLNASQRSLDEMVELFIDSMLRRLLNQERQRLHVLAFCPELLTRVRADGAWALQGDEPLFSRLLDWGVCVEQGGETLFSHRAMISALRSRAPREALEEAISYVRARLPDPNDAGARTLLATVTDLTDLSEISWSTQITADLAELLIWAASVWRSEGEPARAEHLCERAWVLSSEVDDVALHIRVRNLKSAIAYDSGRIYEASEIERATMRVAFEHLGADDPIYLACMANLAISLRALGELPEAIGLLEEVVVRSRAVLARDHPDLVTALSNLAMCLRAVGRFDDALAFLEEAVALQPPDHLRVQLSQNLAAALVGVGRLEDAARTLELALDMSRQMGLTRDAITTQANLAMVYARSGRTEEARAIQSGVMLDCEVAYGPHHPQTLTARSNYAALLEERHVGEALRIYGNVAGERERLLGRDHPETWQSRLQVARALQRAGDAVASRDVYAKLVSDVIRVLGPDHPYAFVLREELAGQAAEAGDVEVSRFAYRELLADIERVLSPDHPMSRRLRDLVNGDGVRSDPSRHPGKTSG